MGYKTSKTMKGPIQSGTLGWTKTVTVKDEKTGRKETVTGWADESYARLEKKAREKLKKR